MSTRIDERSHEVIGHEHKIQKAIYGRVALYRSYCNDCKMYALVIDGMLQCCEKPIDVPDKETKVRMSIASSKKTYRNTGTKNKRNVLENQGYRCLYCGCKLAPISFEKPVFDHFVPWAYQANSTKENMVASCQECNAIKSDKCFSTTKEAIAFILPRKKHG